MSADGRFIACAHSSVNEICSLRVWQVDGPEYWDVPGGVIGRAVAFHPRGHLLAVGNLNGDVTVYDLHTKVLCRRLALHTVIRNLEFHPNDDLLAAACGNTVRLVNVG